MTSLILMTSDSGAGHLKREGRGDRILHFVRRLVCGPIPAGGAPETFFRRRQALYEAEGLFHEPHWFDVEDLVGDNPHRMIVWSRLPEVCLQYDQVTLWIDPDANAQLLLVLLLDWLGNRPEIAPRLWLKQSESPTAQLRPGDWVLPPRPVSAADVALAGRAWRAFGAPTPQAWAALRGEPELGLLPALGRAVEVMLNELPDATGLGATERRLLRLVERRREEDVLGLSIPDEDRLPTRLIQRLLEWGERAPLWYWEVGEALCALAAGAVPAVSGITERYFTMEMHQDPERFRRFRAGLVGLTELGHRLVARRDDWARHNRVHRWWGGTQLTNGALWRWDGGSGRLLPPG